MTYSILSPTPPSDEEAAALAAVVAVLLQEAAQTVPAQATRRVEWWEASGKLARQGLRPARTGVTPSWSSIERLRQRAAGGFYGIVGM